MPDTATVAAPDVSRGQRSRTGERLVSLDAFRGFSMHRSASFIDTKGKPTPDNAIVLAGISVVKKRPTPTADAAARAR